MYFPIRNITRHIGVKGFTPPVTSGLLMQIDVNRESALWTDTSRTTPITTSGSLVKGVTDFSGTGRHWSQAADANAPHFALVGNTKVLRNLDADHYMSFTSMTTIRTVYWAVSSTGYSGYSFLFGDGTAYNFHSEGSTGCFDAVNGWTTVNSLRIDKVAVANNATRPTTLKVLSATTNTNSVASSFSQDRTQPPRSWVGDMAMILAYSDVHTTQQRSDTEDAIKTYLGI